MTILISNLPTFITDGDVAQIFELFGAVLNAKVFVCPLTSKNLGAAVVEMASREEADFAVCVLNGLTIHGRQLMVNTAEHEASGKQFPVKYSISAKRKLVLVEN